MWKQKETSPGIVFEENANAGGAPHYEYIFSHSISKLLDIQGLSKIGRYLGDDQSKKDQKRVEDLKVLGPVIERSMEVMRKGFDARIQQCLGHNNIASFEFCIGPLYGMHGILRREFALATAYIIRQYSMCLDNHFTPEYCVRNAEVKYNELTRDFYHRMNLAQGLGYN